MISFQRLLGREDEFCKLLESSAQEGVHAVAALKRTLANPKASATALVDFAVTRRKDKEITETISTKLVHTFVTPMEREDIEALAEALYKIPKTVEKFAERFLLVLDQVKDVDFSRQLSLMEGAVDLVLEMVKALRAGRNLGGIKLLQSKLQSLEAEADDVILEYLEELYKPEYPALKAVVLKDLYELNEKVVDRCRDAGNVISHAILKNA